ncbi:MAG TPA: glycosyltransferase family 4 protein [Solirubrobacterales bacterium]
MSVIDNAIRGVRWRLRATRRIWRTEATSGMPLLPPEPIPDGRIDAPSAGESLPREIAWVRGWATFPTGPCTRVDVHLGEHLLGVARLGVGRDDLARQLNPTAGLSGFELKEDLATWSGPDGEAELRCVAHGPRGERHELSATVTIEPAAEPPAPPELRPMPVAGSAGDGPVRTLFFTHQLTLGGAQLYLQDLLRELASRKLVDATVLSTMDGPLRDELDELGVPSHITSIDVAKGPSAHLGRVEELVAWADGRGFEAVFVNTATVTTFPGVQVANGLGIPALWAIHESFPPALIWEDLDPVVRRGAEAALGDAAALIFEADATRRLFEPFARQGKLLTIPYGLDIGELDAERAQLDRPQARRASGVPEDAELVVCIGTVEPRKAQVSLTEAFERVAAGHDRAHLAIVGGRRDEETRLLRNYIEASPFRERIHLIPITPDVHDWYGMSDLLVCASDVESLPRTVLEAMAWELPVLATDVYGLPELIDDGKTGWLCRPRDVNALADGLERALATGPEERHEVARRARALVERRHDLPTYGQRIGELINRVSGHAVEVQSGAGEA